GAGAGRDGTHHADPAAPGDQRVARGRELRADLSGQLQPAFVEPGGRRAEDTDRGHRYSGSTMSSAAAAFSVDSRSADNALSASTMYRTAMSTSSVRQIRSRSTGLILPSPAIRSRIQSSSPLQ